MQLFGALFPFARRRLLAKLSVSVGFIRHHFAAQHVEHLVEVRPGIDRHIQRKNLWPILGARVGQHFVKVRVLFVHGVDHDYLRDAAVSRALPHPFRAHADAVLRVHHHEREVRHAHCRERLADKVEVTRRVEDVQLLAHPRAMQQRGLCGNLVLAFGDVIIRNGCALRDVAHAPNDARACEHRLGERRLAGRRVTHDGKIPKIPRRRCDHNLDPFLLPRFCRGRKLKISGSLRMRYGRTSRASRAATPSCGPIS